MPEKVEDIDTDLQSEGLYLKVSESLAELMNQPPSDNTLPLITNTLLSLIINHNLGSSIKDIENCLIEAERKRYLLIQEGNEEELKILDTTIETLSKFLDKAQQERRVIENIQLNVEKASNSIKDLDIVNSRNSSKIKDLEEKILKLKVVNEHVVDMPTEEVDINDIPKGNLIKALVKTLAFLVVMALLILVFSLSCNIYGNVGID
jgi:hypothetical protein